MTNIIFNKYVFSFLCASNIVLFYTGVYRGHVDERNSIESKQNKITIANQQEIISKMQKSMTITNQIIAQKDNANNALIAQHEKDKERLKNAEKTIDSTNRINKLWLQYATNTAESVPELPGTPSGFDDAATTYYSPSNSASGISDALTQCNIQRNILIAVQAWINEQKENFNK